MSNPPTPRPDPWPFDDPENLAVVTLWKILRGASPVLLVSHDEDDGGWQFLDGGPFDVDDGAIVSLRSMLNLDPGLAELADLPLGWSAGRAAPGAPWERVDPEAARDRKLIADVETHGWHVLLIPADDEGPAFAFTVGLWKNFGHPEVIVFGLGLDTMHAFLNLIGDEARRGRRFADGESAAGIVKGFDVRFREVPRDRYREYLGTANWFYKGTDYPALQCIWPDKQDRYPWEGGFPEALKPLQPLLGSTPVAG